GSPLLPYATLFRSARRPSRLRPHLVAGWPPRRLQHVRGRPVGRLRDRRRARIRNPDIPPKPYRRSLERGAPELVARRALDLLRLRHNGPDGDLEAACRRRRGRAAYDGGRAHRARARQPPVLHEGRGEWAVPDAA